MKENTKKGSCYLNGLAIFLSIIFVISIFMAADNAIPLQAATAKSQSTTVANRSKVKKDKWTTLLQKYEKSKKVNQLIFVKYKGKSKANIVLYEKVNGKFKKVREIRKRQLVLMVLQRLSELRRIHAVR